MALLQRLAFRVFLRLGEIFYWLAQRTAPPREPLTGNRPPRRDDAVPLIPRAFG